MGLFGIFGKKKEEKEEGVYKYLRLTPFEAHEAALIFSPENNKELYEETRELLHQAYKSGVVYGVFKDAPEIKNLVGVGLRVEEEVVIKLLPEIHEEDKIQVEDKLRETLLA